ncbi:PQQ-binding-like beta-propeller repeat protein, partial [Verrucomicrobia bacterium]|nr:PQQ-binding-like beta-propeller repeat protein [Verrucomicrobiota bacterium]
MRAFSIFLLWLTLCADANDWPQWRFGPGRGAVSPHALPAELHLQWTRQLPKAAPAWPASQTKLQFDLAPEPVVANGKLFVPSSANDTLTAYDTKTGKQLWRFFAEAPIRFAPVATKGRVWFGSDDGHLYCLNADDGSLRWKFNGGPAERWVIGNERLVSTWPSRGGPVYRDGKIWFTASIWPFMGIFIHCLDAETGRVIWTNSGDGMNYTVQPHGAPSFATVAPQGHLVLAGEHLIVPGGRSTPAVYDANTGKLLHFKYNKKRGHYRVMAGGDFYFVDGGRFRNTSGKSLSSIRTQLVGSDFVLYANGTKLTAETLAGKLTSKEVTDRKGKKTVQTEFKTDRLWSGELPDGFSQVFLQADQQVVAGGKDSIGFFNIADLKRGKAKPTAQADLKSKTWTVLAADDRLFVITLDGQLHCFGSKQTKTQHHLIPPRAKLPVNPAAAAKVNSWIHSPENARGHGLLLGDADVGVIHELLRQTELRLTVVEADATKASSLRELLTAAGFYGERVTVHHHTKPLTFAAQPHFANVVMVNGNAAGNLTEASLKNIFRAVRPYGGVLCVKNAPSKLDKTKITGGAIQRVDGDLLFTRAGALPGAADWSHQYGDAGQSVVSKDQLVKAPLGLLWFGGPSNDKILPRHGHGPSPQVAGGRLFIEGADMLRSVDVYTGRLLWEKSLPELGKFYDNTSHHPGAGEIGSNYVSLQDHLYVVYGDAILELDASSGQETQRFQLQPENGQPAPHWGYLGVSGDYLVATSDPLEISPKKAEPQPKNSPPSEYLAVIPPGDVWSYLAGSDPPDDWNSPEFDDSKWKTGKAGFGYGDNDDATVLDMKGKYTRVYIRHEFDQSVLKNANRLGLMINYDDAFIAYLNGQEILRRSVKGDGKQTKVSGHEAIGHEFIEIEQGIKLLKPGKNLLSIIGHNAQTNSSDFTLDPYLVYANRNKQPSATKKTPQDNPASNTIASAFERLTGGQYAAGSRRLVVFNRKTGEKLWHRDAQYNFRHNNIALGAGSVFVIDSLTEVRLKAMRRRGLKPKGKPVLYALDINNGNLRWQADENVFGTFLNYSTEHDLLLQAGSAFRDRAKDDIGQGMVAYHGRDGKILWANKDLSYNGPCLLMKDKIITNGNGGFAIDIKTGKPTGWKYKRNYGCNTAIGSEHLLTFRSGAAGFYDLTNDGGTGNWGGFRSSCTANLIPANGILNAPDYTRTCSCAYQMQTSLALIHMPELEYWTFGASAKPGQLAINLGAPGDRRAPDGKL